MLRMKGTFKGKSFTTCPEAVSVSYNSDGLCYRITAGYAIDRIEGDSEGLGGVYGLKQVTQPLPALQTRTLSGKKEKASGCRST